MPRVREIQAINVQGRTNRAKTASMRPDNQGRRRERVGDREPDIAKIKQRRMDGEARVLQQRVEIIAFRRRHGNAARRDWRSAE